MIGVTIYDPDSAEYDAGGYVMVGICVYDCQIQDTCSACNTHRADMASGITLNLHNADRSDKNVPLSSWDCLCENIGLMYRAAIAEAVAASSLDVEYRYRYTDGAWTEERRVLRDLEPSPPSGVSCTECHEHCPYQEDPNYICWNCRNYPHYRSSCHDDV